MEPQGQTTIPFSKGAMNSLDAKGSQAEGTPPPTFPKYRGVTKKNNTWAANLWFQGKQVYLGTYPNPSTAARMYDYAARRLLSSNAMRLNFPNEPISESPHSTARNAVAKATFAERPRSPMAQSDLPARQSVEGPGTPQKHSGSGLASPKDMSGSERVGSGSRRSSCSTEEAEALSGLMSLVKDTSDEKGNAESGIQKHGERWSKPSMLSIPAVENPFIGSGTSGKRTNKRKINSESKDGTVRIRTQLTSPPKAFKPSTPIDSPVNTPSGGMKSSRSKSGYFGVSADRSRKKWVATIHIKGGKAVNLGTFSTREEAAMAFDAEAFAQRGVNANLNFPEMWLNKPKQELPMLSTKTSVMSQSSPAKLSVDGSPEVAATTSSSKPAVSPQPSPMKTAPETPNLSECSAITRLPNLSRNDSVESVPTPAPKKQHVHCKKRRLLEALVSV